MHVARILSKRDSMRGGDREARTTVAGFQNGSNIFMSPLFLTYPHPC